MTPAKYGPFEYSPINRRPPLRWPNGERVALWVIPNLEIFPLSVPMPGESLERPAPNAHTPMVREWAQRDYGNRVGVFRLMEVLASHGIRGTAAVNSDLCDAHPHIIEDALKLGWDFIGHGKTNAARLTELPPEAECATIHEVLDRIERATGTRPLGWLGAGLQETWNTLDYLVQAGCLYVADWINDDQPYLMKLNTRSIVSIPYSFEINDTVCFIRRKQTAEEFERSICAQFDVLYEEGKRSGRVMAIGLHPFVIGQPHRIGALDRALRHICSHEGVWKATGVEIVRHFLSLNRPF